jgi:aspartyl-tRNA(Asn)/glutamyl-tRNA(Gln) amidotransferase subunit B
MTLKTLGFSPSNADDLEAICKQAIEANPTAARDYKAGIEKAFSGLMGNVMRQTKGQADGKRTREILKDLLSR